MISRLKLQDFPRPIFWRLLSFPATSHVACATDQVDDGTSPPTNSATQRTDQADESEHSFGTSQTG